MIDVLVWLGKLSVAIVLVIGVFGFLHWKGRPKRHATILQLLENEIELTGLQLVERSGGVLSRGSVYLDLAELEEAGKVLVRREPAPNDPSLRRAFYRIHRKVT